MTDQQLERGNEIASEIRQLQEQLDKWQQADKLKPNSFIRLSSEDDYANMDVYPRYINFDKMKIDAIDTINSELVNLKKELKRL